MNQNTQTCLNADKENLQARAESFNAFYSSVLPHDDRQVPTFSEAPDTPAIEEIAISEQGVLNLLLKIDKQKSAGPDGIANEFLYRYAVWVSKYLTIIFQSSITSGCFPNDWKDTKIMPIHKCGSTNDSKNYVPFHLQVLVPSFSGILSPNIFWHI